MAEACTELLQPMTCCELAPGCGFLRSARLHRPPKGVGSDLSQPAVWWQPQHPSDPSLGLGTAAASCPSLAMLQADVAAGMSTSGTGEHSCGLLTLVQVEAAAGLPTSWIRDCSHNSSYF